MNGLKHRMQKDFSKTARPARDDDHEDVRRRAGVLKMQHPDWDRNRCYQQAYREQVPPAVRHPASTPRS